MIKTPASWPRSLAVVATTLLATPAFAQPGVQDPQTAAIDDELPPPVNAGTVVIVTRQPPIMAAGRAPGQATAVQADAAPHNESWSNVSHINGQVVKVGERGDYLYKWKTTNVATNPIGWMFGFYGLSVSTKLSDNVAIRGDANLISLDHEGGYEIGVTAPLYFRRVFSGPFLEAGVMARRISHDCGGCEGDEAASFGPEVMFGWHWTFDSGFNIAAAIGAMRNLNKDDDSGTKAEPAGYFRIGYAM